MKSEDIKEIKLNSDYFLINWHPTRWCNYHCPYCVSENEQIRKESDLLLIAEQINNFIKKECKNKPIYFKILGGEVCFYNWCRILSKIERINKISITTNFSNSIEYYQNLYRYMYIRQIDFCLMCSKHDENKQYNQKILKLTNWCKKCHYSLPIARLMVDNDFNIEEYNDLVQKGVKVNLSIIRTDGSKKIELSQELKDFMQEYWEKTNKYEYALVIADNNYPISNGVQFANSLEGNFDPTNFLCSAGYNSIFLEPDGLVYRCGNKGMHRNPIHIKDLKLDKSKNMAPCLINNTDKEDKIYCTLCWYTNLKQKEKDDEKS